MREKTTGIEFVAFLAARALACRIAAGTSVKNPADAEDVPQGFGASVTADTQTIYSDGKHWTRRNLHEYGAT
jgi:hypothetical protein